MKGIPGYEHIPGRYGVEIERTEVGTSTFIALRPDLTDADGSLRLAAVLMGIDMGAGLAAGMAVVPGWTVTADIETRIVGRCTVGPLRVDSRAIKPGRTMSVVESRVVDAGADDALVALSTANHGVLEPTFTDDLQVMPVGGRRVFTPPLEPGDSLEGYFGVDLDADELRIEIGDRTRNPWGILHGGLSGMLMEQAARRAGVAEPTDLVVRYLRAVKEGPGVVRVVETVDRGDTRLVRLELVDAGTDRVAVVATVGGRRA
ncbi:MAG: acyl-CoA thioesterase domain-containing protein [Actinomycetota bacterium]